MTFTFHVVSLAHTSTTKDYSSCAFTSKARKFADMMKSLGHTVYLYGGEDNEAACDEFIPCITGKQLGALADVHGPEDILKASFDPKAPHWLLFNANVIEAISSRIAPRDFICIIGGETQRSIAEAFPAHMTVEFGVGYWGSFARYRVFESYAIMHATYGAQQGLDRADGRFYDRVIGNYFEVDDLPFYEDKANHFAFVGRLTDRKGFRIALAVAEALVVPLVMAGHKDDALELPSWVDYRGVVGPEERGKIMGRARAVLVPTLYLEPFGGVAVEAMMCGTPVITTDWGAFVEYVTNGVDGFRCRSLQSFVDAASAVDDLDNALIRERSVQRFSTEFVRHEYQSYFEDLTTLWDGGWGALREVRRADTGAL